MERLSLALKFLAMLVCLNAVLAFAQDKNNNSSPAELARANARLQAEIEKNIEEYNKRPRIKRLGLRIEEYRFARYFENWRLKIEQLGTQNYPEAARGKLYGSLVLTVRIDAEGEVKGVEINRSSGHKILDDAARRIVLLGSPYEKFPQEIRRDTDIIEITRAWAFTKSDDFKAPSP